MSNLLCIDFDWFFPNPMEAADTSDPNLGLYDWGHAESPLLLSTMIWQTRAVGFFQNGLHLPGVTTPDGGWETFWSRFTVADGAVFEFADSNAYAGMVTPPDGTRAFERIVLFDAHHDSGYGIKSFDEYTRQETFSCEDWMLQHQQAGTRNMVVRYPQWKPKGVDETLPSGVVTQLTTDDGLPVTDVVFDAVFACRSGAWVPAWCDSDFNDFINAAPLDGWQVDDATLDRGFDPDQARTMADQLTTMMRTVTTPEA